MRQAGGVVGQSLTMTEMRRRAGSGEGREELVDGLDEDVPPCKRIRRQSGDCPSLLHEGLHFR